MEDPVPCLQCKAEGRTASPRPWRRSRQTGEVRCADHLRGPAVAPAQAAPEAPRVSPENAAIHTESLRKAYPKHVAVQGLSISIPRGGVVGFVGPNGAGKTTTIRMLLGLVKPTSGSAWVFGHSVDKPSEYANRVGALIESPAFYPGLSARKNLRCLATLSGHDVRRVDDLLAQVGLEQRANDPYKSFSLGMKQRLGLAASLLGDPDLLILDEPTNGLDPAGIHEIRDFLRHLGNQGKTIFLSSHLLSEIQRMCDRLVVLARGALVYDGEVEGLGGLQVGLRLVAESPADHGRLQTLVRSMGHVASDRGDHVWVTHASTAGGAINRACQRAGLTLREITPTTPDLEAVILEMTGRGNP